jgi:ribosome-associated protein
MKRHDRLTRAVIRALDELKAIDIAVLDVRRLTTLTDTMIIASGRSDRQVKAIAVKVIETSKASGFRPLGVEGMAEGEWVLVDLGDAIVHVMHPTTRAYYQLEKLWSETRQGQATSTL